MSATDLLDKLERVKKTGDRRWLACCPAHEDRTPSLSVTETSDGVVLINCFAGCGAAEVVGAAGLELSDLFPPRADWESTGKGPRRERSTFSPADALRLIEREALVAANLAAGIARGEAVTDETRSRLWGAAGRISEAIQATRSSRGVRP